MNRNFTIPPTPVMELSRYRKTTDLNDDALGIHYSVERINGECVWSSPSGHCRALTAESLQEYLEYLIVPYDALVIRYYRLARVLVNGCPMIPEFEPKEKTEGHRRIW